MTSILKVQNIQYTDGDAALTIADGGGVTAASTLTSTGTLTASGALEAGSIGATTVANVRLNSQGSYGGNYRAIGWDGVSNGNTHIYSQYNATDHLVLHAGTGKNIVLEAGGSSADIMTITADREVLKPYQPYFFGGRTAGQTGNGADFVSNVAITNRGSHYNTSNGRFTAPVAGDYLCSFKSFSSPQSLSAGHYAVSFRVNGTSVSIYYFYHSDKHAAFAFSEVLNLSASDYVTAYIHGSLTVYGSDHTYATQSFYLLG